MLVLDRDTFSDLAKNLRSGLATLGVPLTYSEAYGAASAALGFRNANSLTAIIRTRPIIVGQPDMPGCAAMREVLESPRAGMENFLRLYRHELEAPRLVAGGDKLVELKGISTTASKLSALVAAALRATNAVAATPGGASSLTIPGRVEFATIPADQWSGPIPALVLATGGIGSGEPDAELCLPEMGTRLRDYLAAPHGNPASDVRACEDAWLAALRGAVSRLRASADQVSLVATFDDDGQWPESRWDAMSVEDEKEMRHVAELHEGNGPCCRYSTSPLMSLGISVLAGMTVHEAPAPRLAILDSNGNPQLVNDSMVSRRGRLWLRGSYANAGCPARPGEVARPCLPVEVVRASCDGKEARLALYLTLLGVNGAIGRSLDEVLDAHDGAKVARDISRVLHWHDKSFRSLDEFGGRAHFDAKEWFRISSKDILRDLVSRVSPVGRDGLNWKLVAFEGHGYTQLDMAPMDFDVVRSLAEQGIEVTVDTDPFGRPSTARTWDQVHEEWENKRADALPSL